MTKSSTQTFARNLDWVGVWSSKLWSNLRTGQDGNFDSLGMLSRPLHSCTHALLIFTMLSKRRGAAFGQFETTICALHHLHETLSFRMFVFIIPPPLSTYPLAITSSSSLIRIRKRSCKYRNKIKRKTATRHPDPADRLTSSLVRKQIPLFIVVFLGWPGL